MQKRIEGETKIKTWHWSILFVLFFVFIVGFIYSSLFFGTYQVDKYTVFRDILTLVLSISALSVAALGVAIYKIVSHSFERQIKEKIEEINLKIRKEVKKEVSRVDERITKTNSEAIKRIEQEKNSSFYDLHLELGVIYWMQYETTYDGKGKIVLDEKQKAFLDLAIVTGEEVLREVNRLEEKDFEAMICAAKNNLAYHLAVRGLADDFERILDLAKYVYTKARNFDYRDTWFWVETYAFSLITIGRATKSDNQIVEGLRLIKGLMQREEIVDRYKKYIQKKYKNLL